MKGTPMVICLAEFIDCKQFVVFRSFTIHKVTKAIKKELFSRTVIFSPYVSDT